MNKLLIIFISLILFVVIIITTIFFFYNSSTEEIDKNLLPPNKEPTFIECMEIFTLTATNLNERVIPSFEAICYTRVAEERGDVMICDNIQDEELKKICQNKFPQIEKCEQEIDEYSKGLCFAGLSAIRKDESICGKYINNQTSRDKCYQSVAGAKRMMRRATLR